MLRLQACLKWNKLPITDALGNQSLTALMRAASKPQTTSLGLRVSPHALETNWSKFHYVSYVLDVQSTKNTGT